MSAKTLCAWYAGKLVSLLIRLVRAGSGVTWAGEIALRIDPAILSYLRTRVASVIVVVGTNGKTTTAAMIHHLLSKKDTYVIHNTTGANLQNGIVGTFITHDKLLQSDKKCHAIFEIDEAEFTNIVQKLSPKYIVLLNLFRDQLDRYGEVNAIAEKWRTVLSRLDNTTHLIVNADDPAISFIAEKSANKTIHYFGLSSAHTHSTDKSDTWADSLYCSNCGHRLAYRYYFFSHLGDWCCPQCARKRHVLDYEGGRIPLSLSGQYNQYNAASALLVAQLVDPLVTESDLADFKPAFGRQEEFSMDGRTVQLYLSKNPTGFNESIRTVLSLEKQPVVLLALNDRIPDGTDVSWIWDVDVDLLVANARYIVCTGDRVGDMAVRLKYASKHGENINLETEVKQALDKAAKRVKAGETIYVLPTYSAMLDVRKILTGRKIL